MRPDALLLSLAHRLILHVVAQEVVQARDLVDQRAVVHAQRPHHLPLRLQALKDCWSLVVHIDNEILELLFVDFEVFHDKVVRQTVPFVEVLPVVIHVVCVAVDDAIDMDSIHVHWNEEKDGKAGTGVDVPADVLVVERDVDPSASPR